MITLRPPSPAALDRFLASQRELEFTYPTPGMTRGRAPQRFNVDHLRVRLGRGREDFARAVESLRSWTMFRQSWTRLYAPDGAPEAGRVVAAIIRVGPAWWANASRVVYVMDESHPVRRAGFAYGTLPGHAECGEERFSVEMTADGDVWYDLLAYSRPRHWAPRVGYPLTRLLQRRFARGSARAMQQAVTISGVPHAPAARDGARP